MLVRTWTDRRRCRILTFDTHRCSKCVVVAILLCSKYGGWIREIVLGGYFELRREYGVENVLNKAWHLEH
jgi:hypothetical protein